MLYQIMNILKVLALAFLVIAFYFLLMIGVGPAFAEPEYISPAPKYIQVELKYLEKLWDTEEVLRDRVDSCRKELRKARKSRR